MKLTEMKHQKAPAGEIERVESTLRMARELHEANPMMGLRGCRLGIVWPEVYEMQARAIFQATARLFKDGYTDVMPEIMIPLVGEAKELAINREMVVRIGEEIARRAAWTSHRVGRMIEIPRAASQPTR